MNWSKKVPTYCVVSFVAAMSLCATNQTFAAQTLPQETVWSHHPNGAQFEVMESSRIAAAHRYIKKMLAVKGPRTVDNTLVPYDEAVRELNAASYISYLMLQVHPEEKFRDRATKINTRVSGEQTALSLNPAVYKALQSIDLSNADQATTYYVKHLLLEFHLAGVDKDEATRSQLKLLQDKLTTLQADFERNIADSVITVELDSAADLDGLPKDFIDHHQPNAAGKIGITTNYPDLIPVLEYASSDATRKKMYDAYHSRAYPKNRQVLLDMMQTRYDIAQLIGYSSWADYYAADKMAQSAANIDTFVETMRRMTRAPVEKEVAMLLEQKRKRAPEATTLNDYEIYYLQDQLKRSKYNFSDEALRPYFPFESVKKGVLKTAETLFNVNFKQVKGAASWDKNVETWNVFENGKMIGRFYLDLHPRKGKYTHAEMAPVLDGVAGRQLPEAILVCNFSEPTASDPGLMESSDVTTFFHEFGHLMHHILGGQGRWAGTAGPTSTEQDFVEAPSQMLEEWISSPQVLATFARHYKTGEAIPADLVRKMRRASAFGRASFVASQMGLSAISLDVYKDNLDKVDLDTIVMTDMTKFMPTVLSPSAANNYASFNHLAGYSSAYYTYMWDKVIAEDLFAQFNQDNLLDQTVSLRYRNQILKPGGSKPASELVTTFLGRPQNTDAFVRWMNEEFDDAH
jgi:thimet oligopeptidase